MNQEISIEDLGYTPVDKAPAQFTIYGFGTRLYGKKMIDEDQNLYEKTLYFTVLFLPTLPIKKYLIQGVNSEEYVIAKGNLSGMARGGNLCVFLCIVALLLYAGLKSYMSSPEYMAKKNYNAAVKALANNDYFIGLENLKMAYDSRTEYSKAAGEEFVRIASDENLSSLSPENAVAVMRYAVRLKKLFPGIITRVEKLFAKYEASNKLQANQLADMIVSLSTDENVITSYKKKQYHLLTDLVAVSPEDMNLAIDLAMLEEYLNNCERCEEILARHIEKLGISEGARILGQHYVSINKTDEAYNLLKPYTNKHLQAYRKAEKAYTDMLDKIWDNTIKELNDGKAPQSFYTKYNAASEQEQDNMVNEYFIKKRNQSKRLSRLLNQYQEATHVVPVALDLGIVMLNRAMVMQDTVQREKGLKDAETTFLAVQGYAGDTDDYQYYLGQVYYWLGKETEGQALFNALLDKYNRSHSVLYSISSILRDLGAETQSKEYAVEAYEKAKKKEDLYNYAYHLSLLAEDQEEKIKWLEKADTSNPYTKADLYTTKGYKAEIDDKKKEALNYFQKAIAVYKTLPVKSSMLNNIALVYMAKYRVGKNESDYNQALKNMDKAVALSPDSSIVLSNSSDYHCKKVYRDLLAKHINLDVLDFSPSLNLFSYLYDDENKKQRIIDQMKAHSSMKKALNYMNKSLLLAPKNTNLAGTAFGLYSFLRMDDEIKQLANRLDNIEVDNQANALEITEHRSKTDHSETIELYKKNINLLKEKLKKLNKTKYPTERAILESYIISYKIGLIEYDKSVDVDKVLKSALANFKRLPSVSTRRGYKNALIKKILVSEQQYTVDYKVFYEKYHKIYEDKMLLCLALGEIAPFKKRFSASPEKKTLENLIMASHSKFPGNPSSSGWFMLRQMDSSSEKSLLTSLKTTEICKYKEKIYEKLIANKEMIVLNQYISCLIEEHLDEAARIIKQARQDNLIIPVSL